MQSVHRAHKLTQLSIPFEHHQRTEKMTAMRVQWITLLHCSFTCWITFNKHIFFNFAPATQCSVYGARKILQTSFCMFSIFAAFFSLLKWTVNICGAQSETASHEQWKRYCYFTCEWYESDQKQNKNKRICKELPLNHSKCCHSNKQRFKWMNQRTYKIFIKYIVVLRSFHIAVVFFSVEIVFTFYGLQCDNLKFGANRGRRQRCRFNDAVTLF